MKIYIDGRDGKTGGMALYVALIKIKYSDVLHPPVFKYVDHKSHSEKTGY